MELCDQFIHEYILLNPTMNDFLKLKEYEHLRHKNPNFMSQEYDKKEEKLYKKYLKLLKKKKEKTFDDVLFYEDLKEYFKVIDFPDEYFPLSYLDNYFIHEITDINSSDTQYTFSDVKSYKDFISRLKTNKAICKTMIDNMKKGVQKKMTIPKIIVQGIIQQLQEITENNTLDNKFNHYRKIPQSIEKEFLKAIDSCLISCIHKITNFLIEDYIDHCRNSIGLHEICGGKKLYSEIVKSYTFKEYTAEDIHKIGLREIKKNKRELTKLQKKMKIKGDYHYFINRVKNNKSSQMKDKKKVLQELSNLKDRLLKEVFDPYFEYPIDKKDHYKIKCVSKENSHMTAYYLLPDFNNERKGTFYINALDPSKVNKHELAVLSVHEGIPGHHYEHFIHTKQDKTLYNRFAPYTSYSEGWALYCEGLFEPKNNYEKFWKLIYNLHRSVRLVIDTGIHYYGWSYDKCFQYMKRYLPFSDDTIKNEVYRYICDPGQAITYKIGELTMFKLRNKYFKKFPKDYKGFHTLILKIGPCPLSILEEEVDKLLN